MKCYEKVECPKCGNDKIGKSGRNENVVQRYRCKNEKCEKVQSKMDTVCR
jgi:predicted RNA-binding Zn-ribbon protein involved in translation (DUF1610 family)